MRSPPPMDMNSLSVLASGLLQASPSSSPRAEVAWLLQQGEGRRAWGTAEVTLNMFSVLIERNKRGKDLLLINQFEYFYW